VWELAIEALEWPSSEVTRKNLDTYILCLASRTTIVLFVSLSQPTSLLGSLALAPYQRHKLKFYWCLAFFFLVPNLFFLDQQI
jgi:hypothetical protein